MAAYPQPRIGPKGRSVLESLKTITASIALAVEAAGALLVAYGAAEAIYGSILTIVHKRTLPGERKEVWLRFGVWLLLGLEFELAADVVRTALSPTWQDIGQLAAIAAIRTFLNFFLERDLEQYELRKQVTRPPNRPIAA
jgi:uncharacterized membrane protein